MIIVFEKLKLIVYTYSNPPNIHVLIFYSKFNCNIKSKVNKYM